MVYISKIREMNIPRTTPLFSLALGVFLGFLSWGKQPMKGSFLVTGQVVQACPYCGGAASSQKMLDDLAKPVPFAAKKMFIKKGETNSETGKSIATFFTDSAGKFKIHLPPGDYCFVEESKTKTRAVPASTPWEAWDADCLAKQQKSCDYVLRVSNKKEDIKITYPQYCPWDTPCMKSSSPLPPQGPTP